jgi:hypothetical protein
MALSLIRMSWISSCGILWTLPYWMSSRLSAHFVFMELIVEWVMFYFVRMYEVQLEASPSCTSCVSAKWLKLSSSNLISTRFPAISLNGLVSKDRSMYFCCIGSSSWETSHFGQLVRFWNKCVLADTPYPRRRVGLRLCGRDYASARTRLFHPQVTS